MSHPKRSAAFAPFTWGTSSAWVTLNAATNTSSQDQSTLRPVGTSPGRAAPEEKDGKRQVETAAISTQSKEWTEARPSLSHGDRDARADSHRMRCLRGVLR